jgi:hypothetical protein
MAHPGLSYMQDHDLIDGYCYACLLLGHGPEPWLARALAHWIADAEAELERRELLHAAKNTKKSLWKEHRARKAIAQVP